MYWLFPYCLFPFFIFLCRWDNFMPSSCFSENLSIFRVSISFNRTLKDPAKRKACHQLLCQCRREWSISFEKMEVNAANSYSSDTNSMDYSTCANEREMPTEQKVGAAVFVNHGKSLVLDNIFW